MYTLHRRCDNGSDLFALDPVTGAYTDLGYSFSWAEGWTPANSDGDAFQSVAVKPGDADYNGVVDAVDAAILAANWMAGPDANWEMGDFNDDGFVVCEPFHAAGIGHLLQKPRTAQSLNNGGH